MGPIAQYAVKLRRSGMWCQLLYAAPTGLPLLSDTRAYKHLAPTEPFARPAFQLLTIFPIRGTLSQLAKRFAKIFENPKIRLKR